MKLPAELLAAVDASPFWFEKIKIVIITASMSVPLTTANTILFVFMNYLMPSARNLFPAF